MQVAELLLMLAVWIGVETGQPELALPRIVTAPAELLHYQYCQGAGAQQPLDDCLAERFSTSALFDPDSGILLVSRTLRPASLEDRADLIVQLARYAGEKALTQVGPGRDDSDRHENIIDCGLKFEARSRGLARAYLVDSGVQLVDLPRYDVHDGMEPWSCRPGNATRRRTGAATGVTPTPGPTTTD